MYQKKILLNFLEFYFVYIDGYFENPEWMKTNLIMNLEVGGQYNAWISYRPIA